MTLVWHDWFATSNAGVGSQRLMLDQNRLLRRFALGSFRFLLHAVTADPAMLIWLSGADNAKDAPNENYARELMELFTLGEGNGYDERDVREQARALTGFRYTWRRSNGPVDFRFDRDRHDTGHEDRLRQARHVRLPRRLQPLPRPPGAPALLRREAVELLRPGAAATPSTRRELERDLPRAATRCGRCSRRSSATRRSTSARDGEAAGRLHRRPAARARPPRRERRPGSGCSTAPGSGSSTRRTSRAGTTSAGSTPPPSAAAGRSRTRRSSKFTRRAEARPQAARGASHAREDRRERGLPARLAAHPARRRRPRSSGSRARRSSTRRGLEARRLPAARPERRAPAPRRVPRPPGCRDGAAAASTPARAVRRGVASAGRGLPAIEPGMPMPAGTGLDRRGFLLRLARPRRLVYGGAGAAAGGVRGGDRGRAGGGRGEGARARQRVPRRRRRLALDARPGRGSALPQAAPAARARARPGRRRSPRTTRLALASLARAARDAARRGQGQRHARASATPTRTSRTSPRATSGRSARSTSGSRPAGSGRYLDRYGTLDNPLQGLALDWGLQPSLATSACRSPRSTAPTASTSGRAASGARCRSGCSTRSACSAAIPTHGDPGLEQATGAARQTAQLYHQLAPFRAKDDDDEGLRQPGRLPRRRRLVPAPARRPRGDARGRDAAARRRAVGARRLRHARQPGGRRSPTA